MRRRAPAQCLPRQYRSHQTMAHLDRLRANIAENRVHLGAHEIRSYIENPIHPQRILRGQCRDDALGVESHRLYGSDIGLEFPLRRSCRTLPR